MGPKTGLFCDPITKTRMNTIKPERERERAALVAIMKCLKADRTRLFYPA